MTKKQKEAHDKLWEATHSRGGASKIARYFLSTVPYTRIQQAYEDLKSEV